MEFTGPNAKTGNKTMNNPPHTQNPNPLMPSAEPPHALRRSILPKKPQNMNKTFQNASGNRFQNASGAEFQNRSGRIPK